MTAASLFPDTTPVIPVRGVHLDLKGALRRVSGGWGYWTCWRLAGTPYLSERLTPLREELDELTARVEAMR